MTTAKTSLFVDTNILVYALDPTEPEKRRVVAELLRDVMLAGTLVLSPQSVNELYRVVTDRRSLLPRAQARRFVASFLPFCSAPLDGDTVRLAWNIQDEHGFGWWDSLLLSAAVRAGCGTFISEDMQDGRVIGGVTILNPFVTRKAKEQ
jgi:predicted nucleic acid-binding protein